MHLDDFFQKPYKLWIYLIFTIFQLTIWIQNIVLAIWLIRIFNYMTTSGLASRVFILIYIVSSISSFYFLYLTIFMCMFDHPSKYVSHFSVSLIIAVVWIISSIILSTYGFSHDGLCKDYVTNLICEGSPIFNFDKKIVNKTSDSDDRYTTFCPDIKYLKSWQKHYIDIFYDNPGYFCYDVAVPVFLLPIIYISAVIGLGYIYYKIKKEHQDEIISNSTIQDSLLNQKNKL